MAKLLIPANRFRGSNASRRLLLAIMAAGVCAASNLSAKTLAFAITDWRPSVYGTPYYDECPEGMAIGNDEIWWKSLSPRDRDRYTGWWGLIEPVDPATRGSCHEARSARRRCVLEPGTGSGSASAHRQRQDFLWHESRRNRRWPRHRPIPAAMRNSPAPTVRSGSTIRCTVSSAASLGGAMATMPSSIRTGSAATAARAPS